MKSNKHDKLVNIMAEELIRRGWNVRKFQNYEHGEIDVLGLKKTYSDLGTERIYAINVEVKSSDFPKSRNKALEQLARSQEYFKPRYRVFNFYAYEKEGELLHEWIR